MACHQLHLFVLVVVAMMMMIVLFVAGGWQRGHSAMEVWCVCKGAEEVS